MARERAAKEERREAKEAEPRGEVKDPPGTRRGDPPRRAQAARQAIRGAPLRGEMAFQALPRLLPGPSTGSPSYRCQSWRHHRREAAARTECVLATSGD